MEIASGFLILLILKISFNYTILLNILKFCMKFMGREQRKITIKN